MEHMHKLIIRPRSAKTACGMNMACYYPMADQGMCSDGAVVNCTTVDEEVSCKQCKSALSPQHRATATEE